MILIKPMVITDVALTASNVTELGAFEPVAWQSKAWVAGNNMTTARHYHAGFGTPDAAAACGGTTGADTASTEKFNGTSWSASGNLTAARDRLAACGTQTAGLALGGHTSAAVGTTEKFNGTSWSATGSLGTARLRLAACGTQTAALAFGGSPATTASIVTELFDGSVWTFGGSLLNARYGLGGFGSQTAAVSVGGNNDTPAVTVFTEEYDGISWATTGVYPTVIADLACAGAPSAGIGFGGWNGVAVGQTYAYSGGVWSTDAVMNTARWRLAGCGDDASALSFGGTTTGSNYLNTTERYTAYRGGDRVYVLRPASTVTVSIAGPGIVTWAAHGLSVGTPVRFTTTGALPTGLAANTLYFVERVLSANTFTVTASQNGQAVVTSGGQSGTHTLTALLHDVYESLENRNFEKWPLDETDWWARVGTMNRWGMFDNALFSQTTNSGTIDVTVQTVGIVDGVAVMNAVADSVRVIMKNGATTRYDSGTVSLVSNGEQIPDMAFVDLPSVYSDTTIQVILTATGKTAKCGALLIGKRKDLGYTQAGMQLGILDYSVKVRDDFGNFTILERDYSRRATIQSWVNNTDIDSVVRTLAAYRALPAVYVGSNLFGSSIIYGFYKDFSVLISYPEYSVCNLEVEGVT
jgi:hypothetical protein